MRARAVEHMQEREDVAWRITGTSLHSYVEESERDGLAGGRNATFTLEARVAEDRPR